MPAIRLRLTLACAAAALAAGPDVGIANERQVKALFLSDIHFDPLGDQRVATQIARLPASEWDAALARARHDPLIPPACGSAEPSTSPALLEEALRVAGKARARFTIVSGDFVVHQLQCRYAALFPNDSPEAYDDFVARTITYIIGKIRAATRNRPVFIALGNHDSGCGNYRRDPVDKLLARIAPAVAEAASQEAAERTRIAQSFAEHGGYTVPALPGLNGVGAVIIDTSPLSRRALDCAGIARDGNGSVDWVDKQIADLAARGNKSWLVGHIPPGIDVRATVQSDRPGEIIPFLKNDSLANLLAAHSNDIALAIFGHTHMDEWRLFADVPLKVVPAVTPSSGNRPAFMVAAVASNGELLDYRIAVAPRASRKPWRTEYSFRARYGVAAFDRKALQALTAERRNDAEGIRPRSVAYRNFYSAGGQPGGFLQGGPAWAAYACATTSISHSQFLDCANWKPGD